MDRREELIESFAGQLYETLKKKIKGGKRSYGFEYEFIPERFPTEGFVEEMEGHLIEMGFEKSHGFLRNREGVSITFEPGGQIEFQSPPIFPEDKGLVTKTLQQIEEVNREIYKRAGVRYLAIDYIEGRSNAPLCLKSDRYRFLHDRLEVSGTRGLEMMKATASIHLHTLITDIGEIAPLFFHLYNLSKSKEFAMGRNREDIFRHTDDSRCGNPRRLFEESFSSKNFIKNYVAFAIDAVVLGKKLPFYAAEGENYESFLYHLTTIFTHIRLNLKSNTAELRTLDSMPFDRFLKKWELFTASPLLFR